MVKSVYDFLDKMDVEEFIDRCGVYFNDHYLSVGKAEKELVALTFGDEDIFFDDICMIDLISEKYYEWFNIPGKIESYWEPENIEKAKVQCGLIEITDTELTEAIMEDFSEEFHKYIYEIVSNNGIAGFLLSVINDLPYLKYRYVKFEPDIIEKVLLNVVKKVGWCDLTIGYNDISLEIEDNKTIRQIADNRNEYPHYICEINNDVILIGFEVENMLKHPDFSYLTDCEEIGLC